MKVRLASKKQLKINPQQRDQRMSTSLVTLQGRSKINPFPEEDSEEDDHDMIVVKTVDGGAANLN